MPDLLPTLNWIPYVNFGANIAVACVVVLLWRSIRRLWERVETTAEMSIGLMSLGRRVEGLEKDVQNIRHDVNAVGHTVQAMQETLGTDIVESEERIVAKLRPIADAQVVIMQELSTRPCVAREAEARDGSCPEGSSGGRS